LKFDLSTEFGKTKAAEYLARLSERGKPCEVKEIRPVRSGRSNRYYWTIVSLFALETGYTKDEAHTTIKRQLGMVYEKNGQRFLKSTSKLDSKEMSDYITRFRDMAGKMGIYLPSSEELEQGGYIEADNYIEQNRNNL